MKKLNSARLEGVPQCHLHLPRSTLDGREVCPVRWRRQVTQLGIASYTEARPAGVNRAKRLIVRYVEHVPAELQFLLLIPGHVEGLAEADVDIHVAWFPKVVPRSGFARVCIAEALVDGFRVATSKELRRIAAVRAGADRGCWRYIRLDVPVGGPARVVERHG